MSTHRQEITLRLESTLARSPGPFRELVRIDSERARLVLSLSDSGDLSLAKMGGKHRLILSLSEVVAAGSKIGLFDGPETAPDPAPSAGQEAPADPAGDNTPEDPPAAPGAQLDLLAGSTPCKAPRNTRRTR